MTNIDLAANYILKAKARIDILTLLMEKQDYSDVVREAQEIVEPATKAMLRRIGIDPPKWRDVSQIILDHKDRFPRIFAGRFPGSHKKHAICGRNC